jgi:hypothetical protein
VERRQKLMSALDHLRDLAGRAEVSSAEQVIEDLPPKKRIELVLAVLTIVALVMLLVVGAVVARLADARGWFDPEPFGPFPDYRILTNLRTQSTDFVDGVYMPNRSEFILLRSDGLLESASADTLLFSDPNRFDSDGIIGRPTILANACGDGGGLQSECGLPDGTVLVTDAGGVALLDPRRGWRTLVSDVPWVGIDGQLVSQESIIAWAASDDQRWLLLVSSSGGLGLFNRELREWVPITTTSQSALLPDLNRVQFLNFARGSFWIAGSLSASRIFSFAPESLRLQAVTLPGRDVEVVDLERSPTGDIVLVTREQCANDVQGCSTIRQIGAQGRIEQLIGEQELHANLGDDTLEYVVDQGNVLVAFGSVGVFLYDKAKRSWVAVETQPVTAYHVLDRGPVVFVATAANVYRIASGAVVETWPVRGMPYRQLFYSQEHGLLGLRGDGTVARVNSAATIVFADPPLPYLTGFTSVANEGSTVLMLHPEGAAVMDVELRRITWLPRNVLAEPLRTANVRLLAGSGNIWSVNINSGAIHLVTRSGAHPQVTLSAARVASLAAPVRSANSDSVGLRVVDGEGVSHRATHGEPGAMEREIGAALPAGFRLVDLDARSDDLVAAATDAIWRYSTANRAWSPFVAGVPGDTIKAIALSGVGVQDGLFAVTAKELAVVRQGEAWAALVGAGEGLPIAATQVSDAIQIGETLWLGGEGTVVAYDLSSSRVLRSLTGGSGEVRFLAAVENQPVWLSGKQVLLGGTVVSRGEVLDAWESPEGFTFWTRVQEGGTYLASTDRAFSNRACFYLGSAAPAGELVDARSIGSGRLLVVTSRAGGIYDSSNHRWLVSNLPATGSDARLYRLGDYLAYMVGGQIWFTQASRVRNVDGCSRDSVTIDWGAPASFASIAIDESSANVAWLQRDGRVVRWSSGQTGQVLAAVNNGPVTSEIRRAGITGENVWLATNSAIWFYNLGTRRWSSAQFGQSRTWSEIDVVEVSVGELAVTVWSGDGAFSGRASVGQNQVALRSTRPPRFPEFTEDMRTLVDSSNDSQNWVFLFETASYEWAPRGEHWVARYSLPEPRRDRQWQTIAGIRGLVEGTGEIPERVYFLVGSGPSTSIAAISIREVSYTYNPRDDRSYAIAANPRVLWRINSDGALFRCPMVAGGSADQGCVLASVAPLTLEPSVPDEVLQVGPTFVMVTQGRLQRLAEDRRGWTELFGPVVSDRGRWFTYLGNVHYWEGSGLRLWRLDALAQPELLRDNVIHLAPAANGELLAVTTDGVWRLMGSGWLRPTVGRAAEGDLTAWSLDATTGAAYAFDSSTRRFVQREQRLSDDFLLPVDWAAALQAVAPGRVQLSTSGLQVEGWWYQPVAGGLNFAYIGTCYQVSFTVPEVSIAIEDPSALSPSAADDSLPVEPDAVTAPATDLESPVPEEGSGATGGEVALGDISELEPNGDGALTIDVPLTVELDPLPPPVSMLLEPQVEAYSCVQRLLASDADVNSPIRQFPTVSAGPSEFAGDREAFVVETDGTVRTQSLAQHPWGSVADAPSARMQLLAGIVPFERRNELFPATIQLEGNGFRVFSGRDTSTYTGARTGSRWAALATNSLRWNRVSTNFEIAQAPGSYLSLAPNQAWEGGRFRLSQTGRVAYLGGQEHYFLNPSGVWRYTDSGDFFWSNQGSFETPRGLAKGHFQLQGRQVSARDGSAVADNDVHVIVFGDARIEERLRAGGVSGTVSVSGDDVPLFSTAGFRFDVRRGIAFNGTEILLLTDNGLTPVRALTGFNAVRVPISGRRVSLLMVGDCTHHSQRNGLSGMAIAGLLQKHLGEHG